MARKTPSKRKSRNTVPGQLLLIPIEQFEQGLEQILIENWEDVRQRRLPGDDLYFPPEVN